MSDVKIFRYLHHISPGLQVVGLSHHQNLEDEHIQMRGPQQIQRALIKKSIVILLRTSKNNNHYIKILYTIE